MEANIVEAISLRDQGDFEASRALLKSLIDQNVSVTQANLHIAWSYDAQGLEAQAVPFYEQALTGNLADDDRLDALLGLGSTLRGLGLYEKALSVLEKGVAEFPEAKHILPFYAMCLYNVGQHKKAVTLLLKLLMNTTNSADILAYKSALDEYLEDIDKTWA